MSEPAQHTKKTISLDLYSRLSTLLQEREAELRHLLDADQRRALQSATGDTEVTDFKDAAAQESIGFVEASKVAHAHAELARVLTARQRLDEGDYGFCEDCGEPIDERRLLALPATSRCKTCQAMHERSHPTSGPGISLS